MDSSGYTIRSSKSLVGTTPVSLYAVSLLHYAESFIIVPTGGSVIYIGGLNLTSTSNGLLIPARGMSFERIHKRNRYELDNIFVVGASISDSFSATFIAPNAAEQNVTPPIVQTYYILTEAGDILTTENSERLLQEAAP